MAEKTANEAWRDILIAHMIAQLRLFGTISSRVSSILDVTEAEIADQIRRRAADITSAEGVDVTSPRVSARLKALQEAIGEIRGGAMKDALEQTLKEMRDIAVAEPAFAKVNLNKTMPVIFDTVLPDRKLLVSLARDFPVEGSPLKAWFDKIEEDDMNRILNEVRIGLVQGQGVDDLARRVVGTARLNGTDGVTQVTRNAADAIVRTAGATFTNQARQMFFEENSDVFTQEAIVATLDARTCPTCRALDGKRYDVGVGPKPPFHMRCRCVRVAVVTDDGSLVGNRPMVPTTEQQLLREFSEKHGIKVVKQRDSLPHGTKGAFDDFSRKRLREIIGRAPAETSYGEFLKGLSPAMQDDILGPTRGKLFRGGKLEIERFADPKLMREYTLRELVLRDSQAFIDAGLDPKDYL